MYGVNNVTISGNIGDVAHAKTGNNTPACTFLIACDQVGQSDPVWVRINTYGSNALQCKDRLVKGSYVIVAGELMNRHFQGEKDRVGLEIRGLKIIFVDRRRNTHVETDDDE